MSRASGNSADRDMWKACESPHGECHPRRQLIELGVGDTVYAKFLKSADYRSFKWLQGPDFIDPGRTLFLSTGCKRLTLPVRAVWISQQERVRKKLITDSSSTPQNYDTLKISDPSDVFSNQGMFLVNPLFLRFAEFLKGYGFNQLKPGNKHVFFFYS